MGFAAGFQVGAQAVERGIKMREEDELKRKLAEVYAKPQEYSDYTPAGVQQIQGLKPYVDNYDVQAIPGAEGQPPTIRYTAKPNAMYYGPDGEPEAPIEIAPQRVQRYGGQVVAGQFDPAQLQGLRAREAARVVGASGDYRGAAALEEQAIRMEREAEEAPLRRRALDTQVKVGESQLRSLGRAEEKEIGFASAFKTINATEYKTPAEKDAAILAAVLQFEGPKAEAQLKADYSTIERNNIVTEGAKFDQKIKQARLKGPAAALKAIDELNDSFTLEIDGFKVTQVNKDGSRVPFLEAKTADEFALSVDAQITEGGAYKLAKFRQDAKSQDVLNKYYEARIKAAQATEGAAANQLTGVTLGYSRDPKTGQPVQILTGMRFNKRTGVPEDVQVQLGQNVVPASALDPKKIADQAEALVGQPIDPTNAKSKIVHTFATAQQAVVDQIFNQYLGTGKPAGVQDLSPAAIAEQARQAQKNLPPAAAAPATLRPPTNLGIDPNRPKSNLSPVSGLPRGEPGSGPNLVKAVTQGLDAGQANYVNYLKSKIANNQPLTVDEQFRAKRFGLQ